jgi:hypothetical protein
MIFHKSFSAAPFSTAPLTYFLEMGAAVRGFKFHGYFKALILRIY